jgi:outer membrane biosynthesis protein TonB
VLSFYTETKKPLPESARTGYVDAIFNISSTGRAQSIQIIDSNPPDVMDSRVQRSIRATRYRPRFIEGQPVATEGVSYRHVFEVKPES